MLILMQWLSRETQAARDGFSRLTRAPLAACVTAAVIGITLTFPVALKVVTDNAVRLNEQLRQTTTLTVYLKPAAGRTEAKKLAQTLRQHAGVLSVRTVSPENGLHTLEQESGLESPASALPENPLPWVLVVTPKAADTSPDKLTRLKSDIEQAAQTDSAQLDTQWVNRLEAILQTIRTMTVAVTALLAVAVLLITGNTIWAVIRRYNRDIQIIRLIGGTARFIRRPFLYAGAFYGLAGAGIAWLMTTILQSLFAPTIKQLAVLYDSSFLLTGLGGTETLFLLGGGMLLGLCGAWLAATAYLRTQR